MRSRMQPFKTVLALAALLLASSASAASIDVTPGDVVMTDSTARTLQVYNGKLGGSYITMNAVHLPSAASIGNISQTAVTRGGLAFTTSLKGPSVIEPRPPQATSYVTVSDLKVPGGKPHTFKVPGLGQGTLATCAVASLEQSYGEIAAAPAAGNVTEVWLLVDCTCNSGNQSTLDSYKILPFSYDSGAHTFQQNRGAEYTTLTGQCNSTGRGYYVNQLGVRGSNLTAVTQATTTTWESLVHFYNAQVIKTASASAAIGNFTDVNAYAIGGYSEFFAAALRGVTLSDPNPPQYTIIRYQAGKKPSLLGGIHPLPNGFFAPLLATRGGSSYEPLYFWQGPFDPTSNTVSHVVAVNKRVPGKAGKAVFSTSRSIIDMDVVP